MNSIASNESNNFNESELKHKEVVVTKYKDQLINNKQYFSQCEHDSINDVCTASYVRGYN